jgi:alkanesulfonate monooxygenase SsuD/methylene tetrahydromethanopterin reductase-like flavin-dependent oxidoreductase (luciferase family)
MGERIPAMKAIWTQEKAEFHGEHVDFGPIWSWPKPAQQPHVPVLVGGEGKAVLKRVLEYGDEWMPHHGQPFDVLAPRIAELQDAARAAGRKPIPVGLFGARPDLAHLRELAAMGVHRAVVYAPPAGADGSDPSSMTSRRSSRPSPEKSQPAFWRTGYCPIHRPTTREEKRA